MGVTSLMMCPNLQPGGKYETMYSDLRDRGFAEMQETPSTENIINWALGAMPKKNKFAEGETGDFREIMEWMAGRESIFAK